MEPARKGRERQRYDGDRRLVAGCLPVLEDGRVVLVGSMRNTDWILPKGGWESDETAEEAAMREAYEEAGVKGHVAREMGMQDIVSSHGNKSRVIMFLMNVTEVLLDWPEKQRRDRQLVSLEDALTLCTRPAVLSILRDYEEEKLLASSSSAALTPACPDDPGKGKMY